MGGITIKGTEVSGGIDKLIWEMLPEIIRSDRQARWVGIIGLSMVLLLFVCSQSLTSDRGVIVIGLSLNLVLITGGLIWIHDRTASRGNNQEHESSAPDGTSEG